eukprot:TRINITY_DN3691_c0_g2_i1.p1 TRINITY_DN3691_c0_g2~~TRINITY_DN3691_c0_g2_i1.p1  ORF type:complete len:599 (+),score=109.43 TRINITY_DN3691_c0_g2_i1:76-1797(+)
MGNSDRDERSSVYTKDDARTIVTFSEAVVAAGEFGDKTIGFIPGFMLLCNNVTGPGFVGMPEANTKGGWLLTMLLLFVCWILSALSCTMLLESIKKMPGNSKFEQRIEFTTVAKHHFTGSRRWMYLTTLIVFLLAFMVSLITSVIESAQTMDKMFIEFFGQSCALQLYNNESASVGGTFGFDCVSDGSSSSDSPFGDKAYVISLGYVAILVVAVPLGFWNLDDNIIVQKVAFVGAITIIGEWCIQAIVKGLDFNKDPGSVPVAGTDMSTLFGSVLFNYAFVTTVPSWCNEKQVGVPINKSIWASSGLGTFLFFIIGICAAAAWDFSGDSDLLTVLTDSSTPGVWGLSRIFAYVFPIFALVTGIPIFSIIMRYNLLENNICGSLWASFWSGVFPWIVAIGLYTGNALGDTVTWSGLLVIVPLNFILPAWFYILSIDEEKTDEEEGILNGDAVRTVAAKQWYPGDEVDAWIPGYQWVPGVVENEEEEGLYPVNVGKIGVRDVPGGNLRKRGDGVYQQQQLEINEVPHNIDGVDEDPAKKITRRLVNKLQAKLDSYEIELGTTTRRTGSSCETVPW